MSNDNKKQKMGTIATEKTLRASPTVVHLASEEEHLPNQEERETKKLTVLARQHELSSHVS